MSHSESIPGAPAEPPPERDAEAGVAGRVARNSVVRAAGEIAGKLVTLLLTALLARDVGPAGLGVYVFALAWVELATAVIGPGLDALLLRRMARDRSEYERTFANVVALKLAYAVPVTAVSFALLWALGYSAQTQTIVHVLSLAYVLERLNFLAFAAFEATERGDLVGLTLMSQRMLAGVLGIAALALGWGLEGVAGAYLVGAVAAGLLGAALLLRHVGRPILHVPRDDRRALRRESVPYSAQELVAVCITRLDTILISVFTGPAVVGLYGAAYRLLEATLFVAQSLRSSFSAMFTYLGHATEPTINAVVSRALKIAIMLLTPCAVALGTLAGPILELVFGAEFVDVAPALRVLAPTVVALGLMFLLDGVIATRLDPRLLYRFFAVGLAVNLLANVLLIPPLEATGAAIAMFLTEALLVVLMLRVVVAEVGRIRVTETIGSATVAGTAMGVALLALPFGVLGALALGGLVYLAVLIAAEARLAPADLAFVRERIRARL